MVSEVDNFIRSTRQWVETCLKDISGYPDNAYLKIPKWANNSGRPSPKEGFMGFNDTLHKFEYYNGSAWTPLEYWAEKAGTCTGNSATATKATRDADNNIISSTYLKLTEVCAKNGGTPSNGQVPRFYNGRIKFPNGSEMWVE